MQRLALIAVLFPLVLSCVNLRSEPINIVGTLDESKWWNIRDFLQGDNLQYKAQNHSHFTVQQPVQQLGQSTFLRQINGDFLAAKAYSDTGSRNWKFQFGYLEQTAMINKIYVDYDRNNFEKNKVPNFRTEVQITNDPQYRCFDFEYVASNRYLFDCYKIVGQSAQNIFYVLTITPPTYELEEVNNNVKTGPIKARRSIIFDGKLFRASLAHQNNALQYDDCEIEVFLLESNLPQSTPVSTLTSSQYANLVDPDAISKRFRLIDVKIFAYDQIYVLDADYRITRLEFNPSTLNWKLLSVTDLELAPLAFDVKLENSLSPIIAVTSISNLEVIGQYTKAIAFAASFQTQIFIANNVVLLRDQNDVYLYTTADQSGANLISSITYDQTQNMIVSQNQPILILLSRQRATSYQVTPGLLKFQGVSLVDKVQSFTLTAADQTSQECKLTVYFQVVPITNKSVILFKPFLTDPTNEFQQQIFIDEDASGPDARFIQEATSDFKVYQTLYDKYLFTNDVPKASEIQHAYISFVKKGKFYANLQKKDKTFLQYTCYTSLDQTVSCVSSDQYSLPTLINRDKYGYAYKDFNLIHVIPESDFSVSAIKRENQQSINIQKIIFDSSDPKNAVSSISVDAMQVFVVQTQKKVIRIYDLNDSSYMYLINEALLKAIGFTGTFNPKRVFSNYAVYSNWIFIQSDTRLIICSFTTELTYLGSVPIEADASVGVVINEHYLTVIQSSENKSTMQKYSLQYFPFQFQVQEVPLYDFILTNPLIYSYGKTSDKFVIAGANTKTVKNVLLIYESDPMTHQQLFRAVEVDSVQIISADGFDSMILYANQNQDQAIYYLHDSHYLEVSARDSISYISTQNLRLLIKSGLANDPILAFNQEVRVRNTGTKINADPSFDILVANQQSTQLVPLKTNWYSGKVLNFICMNCDDNLKVIEPLEDITKGIMVPTGNAVLFRDSQLLYINEGNVDFFSLDGILLNQVSFPKLDYAICSVVEPSHDHKFVMVGCQYDGIAFINLLQCNENWCDNYQQGSFQLPTIFKRGLKKLKKWNDFIFALDQSEPEYSDKSSAIYIYQIVHREHYFFLEEVHQINFSSVVPLPSFSLSDFELIFFEEYQQICVIATEISVGLITEYFQFKKFENQLAFIGSSADLLHDSLVSKGHILKQPKYESIRLVGLGRLVDSTFTHELLVTTNDQGSFLINVKFTATSAEFYVPLFITDFTVGYILGNYGGFTQQSQLHVRHRYVCIPYSFGDEIVISVYHLPTQNGQQDVLLNWVGAYNTRHFLGIQYFASLYSDGTNNFLVTNVDVNDEKSLLKHFAISEGPHLSITNASKYDKFSIDLWLVHEYGSAQTSGNIRLNKTVQNPDDTID